MAQRLLRYLVALAALLIPVAIAVAPGTPTVGLTASPASINRAGTTVLTAAQPQSAAPAASAPTISVRGASVLKGTTLRTAVIASEPGTVRVGARLHGRTVCTATMRVSRPGRATLTCMLTPLAQAAVRLKGTTFRVTGTLTTASGATASAARTVRVLRYQVRAAVTG